MPKPTFICIILSFLSLAAAEEWVCPHEATAARKITAQDFVLSQKPVVKVLLIPVQYAGSAQKPKPFPRKWEVTLREFEDYMRQVSAGKHLIQASMLGHIEGKDTLPFTYSKRVEDARANVFEYYTKIGKVHTEILDKVHAEYGDIFVDVVTIFFVHLEKVFEGYTGYGHIGDISSFAHYDGSGSAMLELDNMDMNLGSLVHEYGHLLDLWHPPNNGHGRHYGVYNVMENRYEADGVFDNITPYHPLDLLHLGWVDSVVEVHSTTEALEVPDFFQHRKLVKIILNSANDEYLLLANYQGQGIFRKYRGKGVLMWHIKGGSIQDVEMPLPLETMGHSDPVFGEDWLDLPEDGWTGGQEAFWTPELGKEMTPYTNPNTSMYVGYSRYEAQVRASGVSLRHWRNGSAGAIVLDVYYERYNISEAGPDSSLDKGFPKMAGGTKVILETSQWAGSQSASLYITSDSRLISTTGGFSQVLEGAVDTLGSWLFGDFGNNGILKLAIYGSTGTHAYQWDGKWSLDVDWDPAILQPQVGRHSVYLDLDDNGRGDLVELLPGRKDMGKLRVRYLPGEREEETVDFSLPGLTSVEGAFWEDLNSDGLPDLVTRENIFMNRDTAFHPIFATSGIKDALGKEELATLKLGDYNADGKGDLLAKTVSGTVLILLNLGGEHFSDLSRLYPGLSNLGRGHIHLDWTMQGARQTPLIEFQNVYGDKRRYTFPPLDEGSEMAILKLTPEQRNPLGLGTKIRVYGPEGLFWSREIHAAQGSEVDLERVPIPLPADDENSVVVHFNSGETRHFSYVAHGKTLVAEQATVPILPNRTPSPLTLGFDRDSRSLAVEVPESGTLKVALYGLDGRFLGKRLRLVSAGRQTFFMDQEQELLPPVSGVYLVRASIGRHTVLKRILFR